jgi:hypothetical protein
MVTNCKHKNKGRRRRKKKSQLFILLFTQNNNKQIMAASVQKKEVGKIKVKQERVRSKNELVIHFFFFREVVMKKEKHFER